MKRFLAMMMAVLLMVSIVGCGDKNKSDGNNSLFTDDEKGNGVENVVDEIKEEIIEDKVATDLEWTFEDGVLTISGHGRMPDYGIWGQPWDSPYDVKSIVISDYITHIGEYAFYDFDQLESITLPSNLRSIAEGAFYDCWSLSEVEIPDGTVSIGEMAFQSCHSLTKITIPESVTSIADNAFEFRSGSMMLYAPSGSYAEQYANEHGIILGGDFNWTFEDGTLTIEVTGEMPNFEAGKPWEKYSDEINNVVLSQGITSIGEKAFEFCDSLSSITIPDSVTSIGECAFRGCYSLSSITLPDSVTSIGKLAFDECYNLNLITLPKYITEISVQMFGGCDNLSSISIPDSVTKIGDDAFRVCEKLSSITIPNSVTTIGDLAFYNCSNLSSITIPASVTSIGENAFLLCNNLTIHAPAGSYAEQYAKENNIPLFDEVNMDNVIDCVIDEHKLSNTNWSDNCIIDETGIIKNSGGSVESLAKRIKYFYDTTGIQPYVYLVSKNTTVSNYSSFASDFYENNISNDYTFVLFIFEDSDYLYYECGADASSIMDQEMIDVFWSITDEEWNRSKPIEDCIANIFVKTADRIALN